MICVYSWNAEIYHLIYVYLCVYLYIIIYKYIIYYNRLYNI